MDFFHGLQVAIMLTVMTNVMQFAHWTVSRKRKNQPHCRKMGPVYLLMVATVLVMVQPTCMLVIGSWNLDNFFFNGGDTGTACMTDATCHNGCMADHYFSCNTTTGACAQETCVEAHKTDKTLPCSCAMDSNALQPNTTVGLCIQIFCTYLGFLLLFIGVFQATELHKKLCKRWKELRGPVAEPEPECAT